MSSLIWIKGVNIFLISLECWLPNRFPFFIYSSEGVLVPLQDRTQDRGKWVQKKRFTETRRRERRKKGSLHIEGVTLMKNMAPHLRGIRLMGLGPSHRCRIHLFAYTLPLWAALHRRTAGLFAFQVPASGLVWRTSAGTEPSSLGRVWRETFKLT